jgi:tripartite-type tricarboxylate transporter receptor subunit TctC
MSCRYPRGILVAWSAVLFSSPASAQEFPTKPVRLVVSFAPGGSVDLVARLLAQKLSDRWGQQVVVDNRPGAGGNVSAEIAARAPSDGYTLYLCSASFVVNPSLYGKTAYDPVRDFAPVSLISLVQNILVAYPRLPVNSVKELISLAQGQPGRINYASTGSGSSGHLVMELFRSMAGIDLVHVPYKVIGQAQSDLISGQVSLFFPTTPGALPHIQAGRMKALAVAGASRSPVLPAVPTVSEAGVPGFEASTWYALLAPARTPATIVGKLNSEVVSILRQREVEERLSAAGVEVVGSSPEALARHILSEIPKWARVVKQSGARVD